MIMIIMVSSNRTYSYCYENWIWEAILLLLLTFFLILMIILLLISLMSLLLNLMITPFLMSSNRTYSYCYENWVGEGINGPAGRSLYTVNNSVIMFNFRIRWMMMMMMMIWVAHDDVAGGKGGGGICNEQQPS